MRGYRTSGTEHAERHVDLATIDADSHLYEPRTMWRHYIDPEARDSALAIEDDELGYPWLTWRGRRLHTIEVPRPFELQQIGDTRQRRARGEPAEVSYNELLPDSYTQPKARVVKLDEFGVDASVVFPNYGLLWETALSEDLPALCANMRAFNRWIADAAAEGGGRLFGVGHVTLRDTQWAVEEIATLARNGVKLAMVAPVPVDGKPLAHRDLDPVWQAFSEHDVAVVFHVGDFHPLPAPWYEGETEPVNKLMDSLFLWFGAAVATANLIVNGTLERFPELRIGIIELTAAWVPHFLLMLDGTWGFYAAQRGEPYRDLPLAPSEYFRRHVRVGALGYEQPARLIELVGEDTFMFGSDWPHAEGIADPIGDYERMNPDLEESARDKLFSGNVRWLLNV